MIILFYSHSQMGSHALGAGSSIAAYSPSRVKIRAWIFDPKTLPEGCDSFFSPQKKFGAYGRVRRVWARNFRLEARTKNWARMGAYI